ncbi:hypothetical protein ACFCYH_27875 [Streptomyces sp. NPDC056400]|uniref:hypothetical protein n=1 Tax=Streptomyces sp. NPDC056400 TaxID=3345808 RepID=UPI0035DCFBE1
MARTAIRTKLAAAASPAHAAGAWHGCPSGAVCISPRGAGWNNDRPSRVYGQGVYELYDQEGTHFIVNNQTDGGSTASATTPTGARATRTSSRPAPPGRRTSPR